MAIQLDGTTGISTSGNIIAAGTLTVGLFNPGNISASGNVVGANLITAGELSVGGNSVITGDLTVVGNASLSGNIIGDKITNGSTSVEIPVANGNVSFTIGGSTNVVVVTTTGGFVTGVISATGNITGSNLNASGLSLASNVLSAINSTSAITTSANVSANNVVVTNHINSSGNISGGNVLSAGQVSAIGNVTGSNLLTAGVVSSAGNITGGNIVTIGLISSAGNITGDNILTGGLISATGNITGGNILGGANVNATTHTGTTVSVTGNITGGNLQTSGTLSTAANIIIPGALNASGNGTIFFNNTGTLSANIILYQEGANGNVTVRIGESATEGFGLYSSGTIGAVGNLTSLSNIIGNNISSANIISAAGNITGNYFLGNGSQLTGIDATSIQNGTSNVRVVSSGGNVAIGVGGTSNVAVYATTGEYVTGLISATGNIIGGNILGGANVNATTHTGTTVSVTGNITGGNANISGNLNVTSSLTVSSNETYGNVVTTPFASVFATGAGGNPYSIMQVRSNDGISGMGMQAYANINGLLYANTGITFATGATLRDKDYPTGGTTRVTIDSTGLTANGIVSASGNVTGANILTGGNVLTGGLISATGNITGGNILGGGLVNATSLTGTTVSASGNVTSGNLLNNGLISSTGNSTAANYLTGGLISATGNITGGNILGGGLVNATSLTGTTVSATGNITGGNVNTNNIVGTGLTLVSTGDLTLSATGNINVNNEYINNVPQPVQDGDAVNKLYVDGLVTTGFAFHNPVFAATVTTLATATGGTITYTQPNGVANGVGATLTTTGSFDLIDTANIQTIGTRVLVKDQANAVQNGVYTWANATAIVRSTDADEYGADSATAFGLNDYFFVQSGNVNAGAAYIVNAPTGTITFGTSNITFAEFSKSQVYSANTSAGISLNGTVINALVDNITTAFSSGNIVVKTGAQLTTPNIGAATGTSLSVSGNINGGNLIVTGIVVDNIGNLDLQTTATNGNINFITNGTGNVYSGANLLVTGLISASGNITGGNVLGGANVNATTHTGTTVSVTANITGGNILTAGLISATGNITGGNVIGGANVNATTHTGTTVSVTGNVNGGNLISAALVQGVTVSASGNITGGNLSGTSIVGTLTTAAQTNITSVGTLSSLAVTANISGGNISTAGNLAAPTATANTSTTQVATTAFVIGQAGVATPQFVGATGAVGTSTRYAREDHVHEGVTSVAVGTGISTSAADGAITLTNTGVTSAVAGTGVGVSGATGAVTISIGQSVATGATPTFAGLTVGTGSITGGNIINGNGNGIGNIGSSTVYFNTGFLKATTAQYADLAENYSADDVYAPGTVLVFGGANEVTVANMISDPKVAGVVSTNPAHLMNSVMEAEHIVAVALTGRVPTKVIGPVKKGDMMVSSINGRAQACATPAMGTVIGKALQDFDGESGVIEIVVGRL